MSISIEALLLDTNKYPFKIYWYLREDCRNDFLWIYSVWKKQSHFNPKILSKKIAEQVSCSKYLNCRAGLVCFLRIQRQCLHRNIKILHDLRVNRFTSAVRGLWKSQDRGRWVTNSYEFYAVLYDLSSLLYEVIKLTGPVLYIEDVLNISLFGWYSEMNTKVKNIFYSANHAKTTEWIKMKLGTINVHTKS